ncbi:MAG: hypothetical protein V2A58_11300 [Planctomycetota bacterium]
MSAFVVSKKHVACIVAYAMRKPGFGWHSNGEWNTLDDLPCAEAMANRLMAENVRSVRARYADVKTVADCPGVTAELEAADEAGQVAPVVEASAILSAPRLTPVALMKAISCLDYQCCETDDWDTTPEKRFLDCLRDDASCDVPGYEEADWEVAD